MKIAIAQTDAVLGRIEPNLEKHICYIEKAIAKGAETILFPELSLTGYLLEDRVKEIAISTDELLELFRGKISGNITIIVGFAERDKLGHIFNSRAVIEMNGGNSKLVSLARKVNLPTYGMFDEARHFNSGDSVSLFSHAVEACRAATLICEDMWHPTLPLALSLDFNDVPSILYAPAASPSGGYEGEKPSNLEGWEKNISFYATALGMYIFNAQRVGVEDSLIFAGGSMIACPDGSIIRASLFSEDLITADVDISEVTAKRQKTRIISSKDRHILKTMLS